MDVLQKDIEFQNHDRTLRVAPWLDMSKLRPGMRELLSTMIAEGEFDHTFEQFKDDLLSFCAGEYDRAPRSSSIVDVLANVLYDKFPEYRTESKQSRALARIGKYMLQYRSWSTSHTLESEMEELREGKESPEDVPF